MKLVIRLPDPLFAVVARVYRAQDRLRRAERREALERQDAARRAYCVPCVPFVGWGIE